MDRIHWIKSKNYNMSIELNLPNGSAHWLPSYHWWFEGSPLYSETFRVGFGNLYSETFPGGFGNFSGWIRKLFRLDSKTCPVGFGNFSGWIQKLDSEICFLRSIWRNLTPPDPSLKILCSIIDHVFKAKERYHPTPPHPTPALDFV